MTVRRCLKLVREMLADVKLDRSSPLAPGRNLFAAIRRSAENRAEELAAVLLLEKVATPARAALDTQIEKWMQTQDNADGREAIALAKIPGADVCFEAWLEAPGRKRSDVLGLLDTAILKS